MTEIVVRTQQELDAALKDPANHAIIMIASEDDVTLDVSGTVGKIVSARSGILRVYGDAQVESVYGDARVESVYGDARVWHVCGNARIGHVCGNARIGDVYDNAKIESVYGDAQVESVYGDARVESVYGDARVGDVCDNAKIEIVYGNAKIRHVCDESTIMVVRGSVEIAIVSDDAQVRHVCDNAKVMGVYANAKIGSVYGYAMVSLYDYARVEHPLGAHAIAFVHSPDARVSGAHVIDMTGTESHDPEMWAAHTTADVLDGEVVLWKALGADLTSGEEFGRPVKWEVGQEVSCDDWNPTPGCGGGLHLSPHPYEAIMYREEATRMLKCVATLTDIVPIIYNNYSEKCKVRTVRVIAETNMDGTPLTSEEK